MQLPAALLCNHRLQHTLLAWNASAVPFLSRASRCTLPSSAAVQPSLYFLFLPSLPSDITEMQARAILEAAVNVSKRGVKPLPHIMVPLVGFEEELAHQVRAAPHGTAAVVLVEGDGAPPAQGRCRGRREEQQCLVSASLCPRPASAVHSLPCKPFANPLPGAAACRCG